MNLSIMAFSPENQAIIERLFPDFDARDTGPREIEALMNAAREEGRELEFKHDPWADPAADGTAT